MKSFLFSSPLITLKVKQDGLWRKRWPADLSHFLLLFWCCINSLGCSELLETEEPHPHPHPLAQNYPLPNVVMGSSCLGWPALLSDVRAAFWVVMGTRSGDASWPMGGAAEVDYLVCFIIYSAAWKEWFWGCKNYTCHKESCHHCSEKYR